MSSDNSVAQSAGRPLSVSRILEAQAGLNPGASAILAPGRSPLTYGRLLTLARDVVGALNVSGVGRNDRVAIVLPNGPEMATAFVSVAAGATSAPLNPAYRAEDFDFYLSDLGARALVVQSDAASPAIEVARNLGIPIIRISPLLDAEAGIFTIESQSVSEQVTGGFAHTEDIALVLHTSGTTSRPKIVPLTHANICASAHNIQAALKLSGEDRCLNVMPLFHIHGLIGAVLSSLVAGASVVCTPGFAPARFFEWMDDFRPTWYTAVPTIHQTVLARAAHNSEIIERCRLRFIRSSSSALPPQVMAEMEKVFDTPVIEAYGMTEASHQMASNPLPPGDRKAGSVGVAAGPEIAIMDEAGNLLPPGKTGEIVIRGSNVTHGYENNPSANQSSFTSGWFRTGDQGVLDAEGYLSITGRIKEIINRGGEKISPREVDEVLLDHPAIVQAVTFAAPHATLGEDVAAAVILHENASATEAEIREFAAARLSEFKVPRRVMILTEIPKGPTGKLQRIGLAEKLGLGASGSEQRRPEGERVAPRDEMERKLASIWERILGVESIGANENFFDLGGYSLLAVELVEEIAKEFGKNLPLATLLQSPNVEQQANIIRQESYSTSWASLVPIQPNGSYPPFYLIHGAGGNVLIYRSLVNQLGSDRSIYGLQSVGLDGKQTPLTTIEAMATRYIKEIIRLQPKGPYLLGGLCFGGMVAFEMARQLNRQGREVALLALFDTFGPQYRELPSDKVSMHQRVKDHLDNLSHLGLKGKLMYPLGRARTIQGRIRRLLYAFFMGREQGLPRALRNVDRINRQAAKIYAERFIPQSYPGRIILFLNSEFAQKSSHDDRFGWGDLVSEGLKVRLIPGKDHTLLEEPWVRFVAEQLMACIDEAETPRSGEGRDKVLLSTPYLPAVVDTGFGSTT